MGLSFAGLGIWSVRLPSSASTHAMSYVEIRSLFFGSIFFVVLLILAYLTNPSEASFRTFLTELSFRRHLTKLNESQEQESDEEGLHYTLPQHETKGAFHQTHGIDGSTPPFRFHFANRAAISMRTPGHIFRSFGILTIAAVTPIRDGSPTSYATRNAIAATSTSSSSEKITGSWFIGAFGKWWVGGTVELLRKDALSFAKEEQDAKAGIMTIRSLDHSDGLEGLKINGNPFRPAITAPKPPSKKQPRPSRSSRRDLPAPRSSSPPPLPKSASLPLHASRSNATILDTQHPVPRPPQALPAPPEPAVIQSHTRSPSTLFDQSPMIAEILQQLSASQSAVSDLRTQLTNLESTSAASRAGLQATLDTHKERKRKEDVARLELKSRLKTLEDSKRQAESSKREAEKKLKAAQTAQDTANQRIERLGTEMESMQQRMVDNQTRITDSNSKTAEMIDEANKDLETKRQEIKDAEENVATLGQRARTLEEKIASERERLQRAREEYASRRAADSYMPETQPDLALTLSNRFFHPQEDQSQWPPRQPPFAAADQPLPPGMLQVRHMASTNFPQMASAARSNRPRSSSLTGLLDPTAADFLPRTLPPIPNSFVTKGGFSPFSDETLSTVPPVANMHPAHPPQVPMQNPYHVMEADSRVPIEQPDYFPAPAPTHQSSFGPSQDEWAGLIGVPRSPPGNVSLVEQPPPLIGDVSAFSSGPLAPPVMRRHSDRLDTQRASLPPREPMRQPSLETTDETNVAGTRRWFSSSTGSQSLKEKTGLNPDAKVFSLTRSRPLISLLPNPSSVEPLTRSPVDSPSVYPEPIQKPIEPPKPKSAATSTWFSTFNPFAPMPAEREALQRVLGSRNASHELLSNHSDSPNGSSTALSRPAPSPFVGDSSTAFPWGLGGDNGVTQPAARARKRSFFSSRNKEMEEGLANNGVYTLLQRKETR